MPSSPSLINYYLHFDHVIAAQDWHPPGRTSLPLYGKTPVTSLI
ncbi:hypothetical protein P4S72_20390 [Vibrio sp. PP-XX7]